MAKIDKNRSPLADPALKSEDVNKVDINSTAGAPPALALRKLIEPHRLSAGRDLEFI